MDTKILSQPSPPVFMSFQKATNFTNSIYQYFPEIIYTYTSLVLCILLPIYKCYPTYTQYSAACFPLKNHLGDFFNIHALSLG